MRALHHISSDELMAYAWSEDRTRPEFRHIADHLGAGCKHCEAWLSLHGPVVSTPPRFPAAWIKPKRFRVAGNVRAGALADVSLLCNAGPYELDVLIRELPSPPSLAIAGQVTQAERIHEPVPALDLALLDPSSSGVVLATTTNEFGEFDFPTLGEEPYGLRCGEDPTSPVILLWEGNL
jgi:hypothetical protein